MGALICNDCGKVCGPVLGYCQCPNSSGCHEEKEIPKSFLELLVSEIPAIKSAELRELLISAVFVPWLKIEAKEISLSQIEKMLAMLANYLPPCDPPIVKINNNITVVCKRG